MGPHQTSIILGLALQGRSLDECSRYIRAVRNKREDCKTYGTLGAAIGFMTWLWISSIVVMVGAEINAEVEREAKGDAPVAGEKSAKTHIIASPHTLRGSLRPRTPA